MTEKVLKSVLRGFLGTFTSRNSDYDGYWLFGMILDELDGMEIDLLHPPAGVSPVKEKGEAMRLACREFVEQVEKHGLRISDIKEARLKFETLPGAKEGLVNGKPSTGREVRFNVTAASQRGKRFEAAAVVFVAPHDSDKERRSARAID